jgi:tRNA threonylcarbamoyladenosine biosynthesis protein TsaE
MELVLHDITETLAFGELLGKNLSGGEVIELVGDMGSGKTTFVKGVARGLGVDDDVQSPSFTISRTYTARDDLELHHYDFYRLPDPGIMQHDLAESAGDSRAITIVEWAQTVADILPTDRTKLVFRVGDEQQRLVTLQSKESGVKEAYATWLENR